MKWSIYQLQKISEFPYHFEEELDFTEDIKGITDIISISPVKVTGYIEKLDNETYRFVYHMVAPMVLECSLTLLPCDFTLEDDYDEVYTTLESEEYIQIEKQTFDTREFAWSNIVIDKPISVHRPDAYEILKSQGIDLDEEIPDDGEILYYSSGEHVASDEED